MSRLPKANYAGTGKSSLITCLVKDHFRPTKIQPMLPPLTIGAPDNVQTTIVDTSGVSILLQEFLYSPETEGVTVVQHYHRNGMAYEKKFVGPM